MAQLQAQNRALMEQMQETEQRAQSMNVEVDSARDLVKALETALESAKLIPDPEEALESADSLRSKLSMAEEENSRLRLKYANIERKTRRMSDVRYKSIILMCRLRLRI